MRGDREIRRALRELQRGEHPLRGHQIREQYQCVQRFLDEHFVMCTGTVVLSHRWCC